MSWKTTCYLGDWSFLWDARFTGPDALQLFRDTGINSVENFEIGQAKHLVQCNEQGKVIAEGILMRLGEDDFSTQSTTAFWSTYVAHRDGYDVTVTKPATFQFQVSGPTALATCQAVTGEDLTDIRFMRFRSHHSRPRAPVPCGYSTAGPSMRCRRPWTYHSRRPLAMMTAGPPIRWLRPSRHQTW